MNKSFDPIIQTCEAAQLLGYRNRQSLWRLVREGKLAAPIKLTPRRCGWRQSTLEAFIAAREKAVA